MALDKVTLENMPAPARHCLYIVLILVLAGLWYWMYQKPRNEELVSINNRNDTLRLQLRQAEAVKAKYEQFQRDLEEIDARLTALQTFIPTKKEAAEFLRSVQDMAASSNLLVNLFRPNTLVSREFYNEWPVEVKLEGNYHGLGSFFESMSQAQRIVDVPMVAISNIGNQTNPSWTLIATGTIITYVRDEQPGQYTSEEK